MIGKGTQEEGMQEDIYTSQRHYRYVQKLVAEQKITS
jgi:hypothetical protein